jgi:hypothetical protein
VVFEISSEHANLRRNAMVKRTILLGVLCVLFLGLLASPTPAQIGSSGISGTVTDPTGAVIPGAKVTITNQATNVSYSATTNSAGAWAFLSLPIGMYTVVVEATGFKTVSSKDNVIELGHAGTVDIKMEVGQKSDVVSVESSYEKLESSSAKIGNVVEQKAIESLPLNGRNPLSLMTLEPGVVQRSYGGAGSGVHINGSRDRAYNVTIDGIEANESTVPNPMANMYRLNPDNVQEFRVITSNATPEEGRNSGANMAVATKSGTNQYHGNLFNFFRNTALNSNEFFANAMSTIHPAPRPIIQMNQFGAEGGGPIIKNKTFVFASYQNQRIITTQPIDQTYGVTTQYTPTLLSGIYRYWIADPTTPFSFNGQTITRNTPALVNPTTGALLPGVPICGGSVVTNCVASYNIFANDPKGIGADPKIMSVFKGYPTPNNYTTGDGLNTATYSWNPPAKFQGPNILIRVDHNFNANNNFFARWMQASYNTLEGDPLNARPIVYPGLPPMGEVFRLTKGLAVSWRRVISPTIVNEFTMGFSRFVYYFSQGEANPAWPNIAPYVFANVTYPYNNNPRTVREVTTPQFIDNVSYVKGSHVFRMGANVRLYEHNDQRGQPGGNYVTPQMSFSATTRPPAGFTTPTVASSTRAGIYSSDSSRLLGAINDLVGIPAQITQYFLGDLKSDTFLPFMSGNTVTMWVEGHRLKQYNFFFQDEWKFRPNITLNYGVRWEINTAPTEAGGRVYVPNNPIDGSQGPVTFQHTDRWFKRNNIGALAPRFAIAWNPRGNSKLVVRSGYGIYFDPLSSFQITSVAGNVPGLVTNCSSIPGGATTPGCVALPDLRINQGFPNAMNPPTVKPSSFLTLPAQLLSNAPAIVAIDPQYKLPTVHQWNLSIQRELPMGFIAQGAYIGHRGTRLQRAYDLNQVNGDQVLSSFLIMQKNYNLGCKGDGTGCPAGVTGTPVPIVVSGAIPSSLLSTVINNSTVYGYLTTNALGSFASRIEQNTLNLHLRPNQQFAKITYLDSGGDSYYHAFQATLRKRFDKGLLFGLAYTFGKSIDDMSVDPIGASSGGGLSTSSVERTPVDIRNWRNERGRSNFDRRNVLMINTVYDLPVGRGKALGGNMPSALNHVFGGWSVNGIYTFQSGEPFSVTSGTFTQNASHWSRAALVGAQPSITLTQLPGIYGPVFFTDASAFKIPDPGSDGAGRNTFQSPNYWNVDLGIAKKFDITERVKLNFRMEMFNALNHPNFDNPVDASVGSPSIRSSVFAQSCCATVAPPATQTIIQTGESARIIQLALKLSF